MGENIVILGNETGFCLPHEEYAQDIESATSERINDGNDSRDGKAGKGPEIAGLVKAWMWR